MSISDEVLLYIRNLEDRVGQLESGSEFPYKPVFPISTASKAKEHVQEDDDDEEVVHGKEEGGVRPESVSNAMKVLEVHEDMLERGETLYATFIDYSAAFDSVSHKFLDEALKRVGASHTMFRAMYKASWDSPK